MALEHMSESGADLSSEYVQEMAKYGIERTLINQFLYGNYRYTNLEDAIAEAKRHPRSANGAERQI